MSTMAFMSIIAIAIILLLTTTNVNFALEPEHSAYTTAPPQNHDRNGTITSSKKHSTVNTDYLHIVSTGVQQRRSPNDDLTNQKQAQQIDNVSPEKTEKLCGNCSVAIRKDDFGAPRRLMEDSISEVSQPMVHPYLLFMYDVLQEMQDETDTCQNCVPEITVRALGLTDIQFGSHQTTLVYQATDVPEGYQHMQIVLTLQKTRNCLVDNIRVFDDHRGKRTEVGVCDTSKSPRGTVVCDIKRVSIFKTKLQLVFIIENSDRTECGLQKMNFNQTSIQGPVLVFFSDFYDIGYQRLQQNAKQRLRGTEIMSEYTSRHKRRSARAVRSSRAGRYSPDVDKHFGECQLVSWRVDLLSMGWGKTLVYPFSYSANFCAGSCPHPMTAAHLNTTKHAYIKGFYKAYHGIQNTPNIPPARCSPLGFKAIAMITIDEKGFGYYHRIPDMVVTTCGCA